MFYPYCGKKGLDFLVCKVMLHFLAVAVRLDWNWQQTFDQLPCFLKPTSRRDWEEVFHNHLDLYNLAEASFKKPLITSSRRC